MDYQSTLNYLYESVPMFQQIGGEAYKPGLGTTLLLDEYFGHPHQQFKTIHIAGTNGKGSCSHTLAAVLQSAGYRVGLYTSPHLIDFRERIRINGEMIPEACVVRFVEEHRSFFEPLHPSFFELTTAMAFRYFADQKVDIAIIETGMGGRLDCTNIISPDLCIITNISLDHTQYLGKTLTKIAAEKAGIIKKNTPVVVGRATRTVRKVICSKANEMNAKVIYAERLAKLHHIEFLSYDKLVDLNDSHRLLANCENEKFIGNSAHVSPDLSTLIAHKKSAVSITDLDHKNALYYELNGYYQAENAFTIMEALRILHKLGYKIERNNCTEGFSNVCQMTGIMGRWQILQTSPTIICDTAHNVGAFEWINLQLDGMCVNFNSNLHIVFGLVNDKDITGILKVLPQKATYYFTKAPIERALPEDELLKRAEKVGLKGKAYLSVSEAVQAAKKKCLKGDVIFVGGSTFIVADLLKNRDALNLY